jgi:hypothetical protein
VPSARPLTTLDTRRQICSKRQSFCRHARINRFIRHYHTLQSSSHTSSSSPSFHLPLRTRSMIMLTSFASVRRDVEAYRQTSLSTSDSAPSAPTSLSDRPSSPADSSALSSAHNCLPPPPLTRTTCPTPNALHQLSSSIPPSSRSLSCASMFESIDCYLLTHQNARSRRPATSSFTSFERQPFPRHIFLQSSLLTSLFMSKLSSLIISRASLIQSTIAQLHPNFV